MMVRRLVMGCALGAAMIGAAFAIGGGRQRDRANRIVVVSGRAATPARPTRAALTTPAAKPATARAGYTARLIVPAYKYPGRDERYWADLIRAARNGAPLAVIVNPGSGSGLARDRNYARVIRELAEAPDVLLLGYVPSGYAGADAIGPVAAGGSTCQPRRGDRYVARDIVDCARGYDRFYGGVAKLDGIFVDEMGRRQQTLRQAVRFYSAVYDGIKAIDPSYVVFGNPGGVVERDYMRENGAGGTDVLVTYESPAAGYATAPLPPYRDAFPASRFGNIVYAAPRDFDFRDFLIEAKRRNVAYVYLTDDGGPASETSNPYDALPVDFRRQVEIVQRRNAGQ